VNIVLMVLLISDQKSLIKNKKNNNKLISPVTGPVWPRVFQEV